ncbi:cupin [Pandoraea sp. NE5]|uniref:AraC family transcriptional regulator n=1 Tax=unclassified Pandoraea TaxID=2624094 RepID=UPI00034B6195|nr:MULTISPECIES: AraC family transcriptional regulator [unclassified Pandoraea]OJY19061.1 MAG: AraC family transcriptional regulator [Pandoraea sp. 64-18]BDD92613.1 cupin [Pandoraea sp. NE5]
MDPLSDVLNDLRADAVVTGRFTFGAPWSLRKPAMDGAPFRTATGEPFYLVVAGMAPVRVEPGDCVLLPHGHEHVMCSSLDEPPVVFEQLMTAQGIAPRLDTPLAFRAGGTGPVSDLYTGVVMFRERVRNPLLASLPPLIHIRAGDPAVPARLTTTLAGFIEESMQCGAGWRVAVARLADVLFIQILRAYLGASGGATTHWLRGMTDPQLGRAIASMHDAPQRPWTVEQLADIAGMSRSKFCLRFRELVGESPMSYLTTHRMYLAAERLAGAGVRIADVADAVGYASEKAFTRAFRRCYGLPPREYLRHCGPAN